MLTNESIKHFSELFDIDLFEISKNKPKRENYDKNKIITIADLHAPFTDMKGLRKTYGADRLYIVGDFLDNYAVSRFTKRINKTVNLVTEFKEAFEIMIEICKHFNTIYYLEGNHCNRFARSMYDSLSTDYLPFFTKTQFNILREILLLIPNLRLINHKTKLRTYDFIHQKNDILFSHVEKSSKDTGKTIIEINKSILTDWYNEFELKPYKCLIQAHTHRQAWIEEGGRTLIQMPAMIDKSSYAFDYAYGSRLNGKPTVNGYLELYIDKNGNFDGMKTKLIKV